MFTLKTFRNAKEHINLRRCTSAALNGYLEQLKISLEARGRKDLLQELEAKGLSNLDVKQFPNLIHPDVAGYGVSPKVVQEVNKIPEFKTKPLTFHDISQKLNILRMDVGQFAGNKSYFLLDDLAELETSLMLFAVGRLKKHGFELVSVPDILEARNIEACGMQVYGERNQVYKLSNRKDGTDLCLSGTSEMALATYLASKTFKEQELPKRLMAVSRCFRAETSTLNEEKGIYRVHQFNKVEMFGVCTPEQSTDFLEEFKNIQIGIFKDLDLNFKVLDMPPHELGAPAYRKYDIESWMPGREMYGELSSCSNCTDYQARRLDIRVLKDSNETVYAHTINGTAAAIPRLLIAILESFQKEKHIEVPKVLQKYFPKDRLVRTKSLPDVKLVKENANLKA